MYLKHLELYGFKTFADRTELQFGPGITAIVGPNGSGKSNISDAILWVLGEQGMKSLRSSKSTDVIFNGSDSRKQLGFAEVHLTLDNSKNLLPTDYTEVTITRRVFRSAESEYQINRVPVRLRDVQDLFMDTGLGKQSYSIISQGEVDAVLSSRSEDRRALFEEVAGITKYKARKKEALRKLEQTRLNLLRVSDIIEELQGQILPLSEQSEKAKMYQRFSDELTDLKLSLLVMQFQGLHSSLQRSKEREEEIVKELESLRHELQTVEIKEATLRAELQLLEDGLEEQRKLEGRMATAVQGIENQIELIKEQQKSNNREIDRINLEIADITEQQGKFSEEIANAKIEAEKLAMELVNIEADMLNADADYQRSGALVTDKLKEINRLRDEYISTLDKSARARNELTKAESFLTTSENRTMRITDEIVGLEKILLELKTSLNSAQEKVNEKIAAREKLTSDRSEMMKRRNEAIEKQSSLRREEGKIRESLAGLKARQRTLQELEESLEGYYPGVRAVISASEKRIIKGEFYPVSDILQVPAKLETAIEVGLGADLQDVVTDSELSAREAVSFLKDKKAGRATFIPLDIVKPAPCADFPPTPGILGVAVDLVDFENRFTQVAEHLLGKIIIAEDIDAALSLAKSGSARGWKSIVTLDGEVVTPARTITGGSMGRGSGLLKRKRELIELNDTVSNEEKRANEARNAGQKIITDIQNLDASISKLGKDSENIASLINEAERNIAGINRDVKSRVDRIDALKKENEWLQNELNDAGKKVTECKSELVNLENNQKIADANVKKAEEELQGDQKKRDEISEKYSALRVKITELKGRQNNAINAGKRAESLRDSSGMRLNESGEIVNKLIQNNKTLQEKEIETANELLRMREQFARTCGDLDTAKTKRADTLDKISENLELQKSKREIIEKTSDKRHNQDIRTTQIESEIGFLETQLFDDYKLTTDQAAQKATPIQNKGIALIRMKELQSSIDDLGTVNVGAIDEFERVKVRLDFLIGQRKDLEEGRDSLSKVIIEIDSTCKEKFIWAFGEVKREFQDLFVRLFGGGKTELELANPDDVLESGIDINVTVPGKRNQNLLQLSGGERALTALALLFAMLRIKPSPFVVLDEIDAPLDEANVGRYCDVLRDFTKDTQFLIITHNKGTMEAADVLYGVTMEKAGVSKIVSVRLTDHHHHDENTALSPITDQEGPFKNKR
jgi:chromosome segregation protein